MTRHVAFLPLAALFAASAALAMPSPPSCEVVVQIMRSQQGNVLYKNPLNGGSCPVLDGSVTVASFAGDPYENAHTSRIGARLHLLVTDNTVLGPDGAIDTSYWVLDRVEMAGTILHPQPPAPIMQVVAKPKKAKVPPRKKPRRKIKKKVPAAEAVCVAQCKAAPVEAVKP